MITSNELEKVVFIMGGITAEESFQVNQDKTCLNLLVETPSTALAHSEGRATVWLPKSKAEQLSKSLHAGEMVRVVRASKIRNGQYSTVFDADDLENV